MQCHNKKPWAPRKAARVRRARCGGAVLTGRLLGHAERIHALLAPHNAPVTVHCASDSPAKRSSPTKP